MARVLHGTLTTGYGGLEMVVEDFHKWMLKNGHEAYVIVGQGTPLHRHLVKSGLEKTVLPFPRTFLGFLNLRALGERFNREDTAILLHRQAGLRALFLMSMKARVAVLSHTFYGVPKKDLWHRILFKKVDQWIALTPKHRLNIIETCDVDPENVIVIPNGVNISKFKILSTCLPDPTKRIHIGVVARLDAQKGQDLAIAAVKELCDQGLDICLHLFGHDTPDNEPFRPVLEKLVSDYHLQDHVIFEGFEPHIENRLPEMDLVWMPSEKETFGLCIIESMACGVPVIASNAGGVPDIIEDEINGLKFEPKDSKDLAMKTLQLIHQKDLFLRIRKNALQEVQTKYNQEKVWERLLNAILPKSQSKTISETSSKNLNSIGSQRKYII
jgi:glycosyltransferase involved in cell wall biosynthesis